MKNYIKLLNVTEVTGKNYRYNNMKIEVKYIYESDYFIISPWKKGKLINIMETIPL